MTLAELLQELRENILHDRSNRVAGDSDLLWSDATLVRYINEAHRRFARQGLVIRDGSTPEVTEVTLVAGQKLYTLHPSVLAVVSAKIDDDEEADLARAGHAAFNTYRTPDAYFFDPSQLSSLPAGKPVAFSTDEQLSFDDNDAMSVVTMRVYPTPSATYAGDKIKLRVVRGPLENFSTDCMNVTPEIPEDHHLEMLDWAAYLALRIVDVDGNFAGMADMFRASFEQHVVEARKAAMRKMFTPMQWGFGRNGFSWEK